MKLYLDGTLLAELHEIFNVDFEASFPFYISCASLSLSSVFLLDIIRFLDDD